MYAIVNKTKSKEFDIGNINVSQGSSSKTLDLSQLMDVPAPPKKEKSKYDICYDLLLQYIESKDNVALRAMLKNYPYIISDGGMRCIDGICIKHDILVKCAIKHKNIDAIVLLSKQPIICKQCKRSEIGVDVCYNDRIIHPDYNKYMKLAHGDQLLKSTIDIVINGTVECICTCEDNQHTNCCVLICYYCYWEYIRDSYTAENLSEPKCYHCEKRGFATIEEQVILLTNNCAKYEKKIKEQDDARNEDGLWPDESGLWPE
jgi:hypothetical protein